MNGGLKFLLMTLGYKSRANEKMKANMKMEAREKELSVEESFQETVLKDCSFYYVIKRKNEGSGQKTL